MKEIVLTLPKAKETGGTVVYGDAVNPDSIKSIYIPKSILAAPYPPAINITIKAA